MNLLVVHLVQSCNLGCYYCPMSRWMKPLDYIFPDAGDYPGETAGAKFNSLTNRALLAWLDAYCPPSEWRLNLTGGEPGLYAEIESLLPELSSRGYRGIITTNGTLPIPQDPSFIRVAAWHEGVSDVPPYHDIILILEPNPNDDTESKKRYCQEHGIPFETKLWVPFHDKERPPTPQRVFEDLSINSLLYVYSMGQITGCPRIPVSADVNIHKMSPPVPQPLKPSCPRCTNAYDAERFMPAEWLQGGFKRGHI